MAVSTMQFEKPYSQHFGKWFENTNRPGAIYYLLNLEYEKFSGVGFTAIETGKKLIRTEWSRDEDFMLKPYKHDHRDYRVAMRVAFEGRNES